MSEPSSSIVGSNASAARASGLLLSLTLDGTNIPDENLRPSGVGENGSQATEEQRKRKRRSLVWQDFEEQRLADGTINAICRHCKKSFNGASSKGTSHLKNHANTCPRKPSNRQGQKLLSAINIPNKPTKLGTWKFDAEKTRLAFARMIAKHDYPFNMTEHEYFQEYVKTINPTVRFYTRNTVRSDVLKVFNDMKDELLKFFDQLSSRVSLTTDLWTSEHQNKGYCCVTCHYIDDNWVLQKKIIAYHMIPSPHTGIALSEFIKSTTLTWNIDNKLFAIAVDNASSNDVMVRHLKEWLNDKDALFLHGNMFHIRCSAHILNLIVQDGLKVVDGLLKKIRDSVNFCKSSQSRKQKFENALSHTKLVGKGVASDVSTRWNSTFLMLESALDVRLAFVRLKELSPDYTCLPTPEEWKKGQVICDCLRVFYDATLQFSMVKYPSANFYFKGVLDVYGSIHDWLSSQTDYIRDMAKVMKEKFDKYWDACNIMMCIGVVLDPRYKFEFVEFGLEEIYGEDYCQPYVNKIRDHLNELYTSYGVSSSPSLESCSNSFVTNLDSPRSTCESNNNMNSSTSRMEEKFQKLRMQKLGNSQEAKKRTELEKYLADDCVPISQKDFDILSWWKANNPTYPILANMARDILAVPTSTVASESAFSCGGRVITEHRTSLAPDIVEALNCIKDWLPSLKNSDLVDVPEVMDLTGFSPATN